MSEKKLEECSLEDATYIEVGGKVYELDVWESGGACKDYEEGHCVGISVDDKDEILSIPISLFSLFPILGIKTFKEIKPEPIKFEATFAKYLGNWIPLYTMHDGFLYEDNKKVRFKCIQILEEKK